MSDIIEFEESKWDVDYFFPIVEASKRNHLNYCSLVAESFFPLNVNTLSMYLTIRYLSNPTNYSRGNWMKYSEQIFYIVNKIYHAGSIKPIWEENIGKQGKIYDIIDRDLYKWTMWQLRHEEPNMEKVIKCMKYGKKKEK